MKEIEVLYIQPGRYPEVIKMENTLEELQSRVEGSIEIVYPWEEAVCVVCDEEGKLKGSPLNRSLEDYDILAGSFLICGCRGADLCSLTEQQKERYEQMFVDPQLFARTPYGIQCLPCLPEQYDRIESRFASRPYFNQRDEAR